MSYERALTQARLAPLALPDFDAVADAADRERAAYRGETDDRSVRARRWMLLAAALWLLLPIDAVALTLVDSQWASASMLAFDLTALALPPALISIWGARLIRCDSFRAAILSRAIAASNLVVALLYAIVVGGVLGAVFASLLALASGRVLQLLGDRGLDGASDPSGEFEPVRFRGILIGALIMAFADALTLLFSSSVASVRFLAGAVHGIYWAGLGGALALTVAAAALMAANVWGLLRMRSWALFGNMLSNLAVAGLALSGLLATNNYVSIALAVTAAIQLLLVVPILATALGDREAGRAHERLGALVRWIVPALVLATVVAAALNFGPGLALSWIGRSF